MLQIGISTLFVSPTSIQIWMSNNNTFSLKICMHRDMIDELGSSRLKIENMVFRYLESKPRAATDLIFPAFSFLIIMKAQEGRDFRYGRDGKAREIAWKGRSRGKTCAGSGTLELEIYIISTSRKHPHLD